MKTSHGTKRRLGVFAPVVAAILAITACATDPIGPGMTPGNPHFAILQDENLVPVSPDYANPGNLEPFTTLWSVVDEDVPNDDTDYIWRYRTGLPPTNSEATLNLSDPVGTPSATQTHTLRVRWRVAGNYSNNTPQPTMLTFQVKDVVNGTIATGTSIPTGNGYIDASTGVNSNLISDYSQLKVRLNIELKPATSFDQIQARITWVRLEIR